MFMKSFRLVFFFFKQRSQWSRIVMHVQSCFAQLLKVQLFLQEKENNMDLWIQKQALCFLTDTKNRFWVDLYIKIINLNLNFGKWFSFEIQCTCMRPAGFSPVGFQLTPAFLRKSFCTVFCLCKIKDIKMENFHTDIIIRNYAAPMFFLKSQNKDGEREKTGHVLRKGTIESSIPLKAPKESEN